MSKKAESFVREIPEDVVVTKDQFLNGPTVDVSMTRKVAEFLLSVLEHPASAAFFDHATKRSATLIDNETIQPDPLPFLRAVSSMCVLKLTIWDFTTIGWTWIGCVIPVAKALGLIDKDAPDKGASFVNAVNVLIEDYFDPDNEPTNRIHHVDALSIHISIFHRAVKMIECEQSHRHAVATYLEMGTFAPEDRLPSYGRNERCLCGSGKKYKKCCMSAREG